MAENFGTNNLESEIAELSRQIEEKKKALEAERGIVEDKEALSEVVMDHLYFDEKASGATSPASAMVQADPAKPVAKTIKTNDYLDALDPDTIAMVSEYIAKVPSDGIKKTIAEVKNESALVVDAFHDALVTRLYDEMKTRGLIK